MLLAGPVWGGGSNISFYGGGVYFDGSLFAARIKLGGSGSRPLF